MSREIFTYSFTKHEKQLQLSVYVVAPINTNKIPQRSLDHVGKNCSLDELF